jgi:hypothetical protein
MFLNQIMAHKIMSESEFSELFSLTIANRLHQSFLILYYTIHVVALAPLALFSLNP